MLFSIQSAIGFPDADFVIAVVANGTLIITCRSTFQIKIMMISLGKRRKKSDSSPDST